MTASKGGQKVVIRIKLDLALEHYHLMAVRKFLLKEKATIKITLCT